MEGAMRKLPGFSRMELTAARRVVMKASSRATLRVVMKAGPKRKPLPRGA
jgi:hypothetical protein